MMLNPQMLAAALQQMRPAGGSIPPPPGMANSPPMQANLGQSPMLSGMGGLAQGVAQQMQAPRAPMAPRLGPY